VGSVIAETYILRLGPSDFNDLWIKVEELERQGVDCLFLIPPDILLVRSDFIYDELKNNLAVHRFEMERINNNNNLVNSVYVGLNKLGIYMEPIPKQLPEIEDILLISTRSTFSSSSSECVLPYYAQQEDLSEFMLGKIAVSVIFVESNGELDQDLETWAEETKQQIREQISAGLAYWFNVSTVAPVIFVWDEKTLYTKYEPITRGAPNVVDGDVAWISDLMRNLGYETASHVDQTRMYCQALRCEYKTDWAFAIFVVNSRNDEDGRFLNDNPDSEGSFAYAWLGGPFFVMTYDNGNWGINQMNKIVSHEVGHIFYALDEYHSAMLDPCKVSGYLGILNANSEYRKTGLLCAQSESDCIMKNMSSQCCGFTLGQTGLLDSDSDSIPDILDTTPKAVVNKNEKISEKDFIFYGFSQEVARRNRNYYGSGRDISFNYIKNVFYRLNGQDWKPTEPSDGAFDEPEEFFIFNLEDLADGSYLVETKAVNSVGNESEYYFQYNFIVGSVTPYPTPTPVLPNLVVGEILSMPNSFDSINNSYPMPSRVGFTVSVKNISDVGTIVPFNIKMETDLNYTEYKTEPYGILAYQEVEVSFSEMIFPVGGNVVIFTVDSNNSIRETNEMDNTKDIKINIYNPDVNSDNIVDKQDLFMYFTYWHKESKDEDFDRRLDLIPDGKIDSQDILTMLYYFLYD